MDETPASSQNHRNNSKVAKPDLYHGDRSTLEDWLLQFDLYFKFGASDVDDDDQPSLAASFLRGEAAKWIRPHLIKYMDNNSTKEPELNLLMEDFDEFKRRIRIAFGMRNETPIAERAIQRLVQTKDASSYANAFKGYAVQTDWNDQALRTLYKQGLKADVQTELMRSGADTVTLDELITESIRLDVELYELRVTLRNQRGQPQAKEYRPRYQKKHGPNVGRPRERYQPRNNPGVYNNHGLEPMHLDNINQGPDRKPTGKKFDKKSITCYGCGKTGHMKKDCRSNTNKVQRQINMIGDDANLGEDWDVVPYDDDLNNDSLEEGEIYEDSEETLDHEPLTKHQKMQQFQDENRAASPHPNKTTWPDDRDMEEIATTAMINGLYAERQRLETENQDLAKKLQKSRATQEKLREQANNSALDNWQECEEKLSGIFNDDTASYQRNPRYATGRCPNKVHSKQGCATRYEAGAQHYLQPMLPQGTTPHEAYERTVGWLEEHEKHLAAPTDDAVEQNPRTEDWPHPHLKKHRTKGKKAGRTLNGPMAYLVDHRNLRHGTLSWTACATDECMIHKGDKLATGRFPQRLQDCSYHWFDCSKNHCSEHLWDKREASWFANHSTEADAFAMHLLINGDCTRETWHTCLNPACTRHATEKWENGFTPSLTFLDQSQSTKSDPTIRKDSSSYE